MRCADKKQQRRRCGNKTKRNETGEAAVGGTTSVVPRDSSRGSHGRGRFYISSIISDVLIYFLLLIICSITRTNIIGCLIFPFHFDIFNFDSLFIM